MLSEVFRIKMNGETTFESKIVDHRVRTTEPEKENLGDEDVDDEEPL